MTVAPFKAGFISCDNYLLSQGGCWESGLGIEIDDANRY